ncbi:ribosomal-protein-alanine N-acetyltransferase [Pedobacter cryoconitis]|uniref:GNAT family N-acetyltransferase n=1 Tax=Pedobacter cryoconitis TaxID=188932 RepID=UPI00160FEF9B|nr:GNAT family N-acetyltransferase [Pedobacter cryoconitis]MBB6270335.1 ribosomal-protein-alanine N-acetyltransferase [Pedobacter cryoconitis]
MDINPGEHWPDEDMLETLPRIIDKLKLVDSPSGFEFWIIIEKKTNLIIGDTGFKGLPDINGCADIGYGIIARARRQGYATEAVNALIDRAFQQPELNLITASCERTNTGSAKVLQGLGFSFKGTNEGMFQWELPRMAL